MENVFLSASAGSGKTFALSIRYLALLFEGVNASQILTITFTKKAANEMLERITNNLESLNNFAINKQSNKNIDSIINALKEYNISQDRIISSANEIFHNFLMSQKRISTIDAFFSHVLKKFSFFVNIRNDFIPSEDNFNIIDMFLEKIRSTNLMNVVLNINEQDKNIDNINKALQDLLIKSIEFSSKNDFGKKLSKKYILHFIQDLIEEYNIDDIETYNFKKSMQDVSDKIASIIKEAIKDVIDDEEKAKNAKGIIAKCANARNLLDSELINKEEPHTHRDLKKFFENNINAQIALKNACKNLANINIIYHFYNNAKKLENLHQLLQDYEICLDDYEMKNNELSFNSITRKVFYLMNDVLENEGFNSQYFYFRLDSIISHILFDEVQDTSITQYRIFKPIIDEMQSGIGTNNKSIFMVGDDKQSIYGFRGANQSVFESFKHNMIHKSLDTNYRSYGNIINFINERFQALYPQYVPQKIAQKENEKNGIVSVKIYESATDKKDKIRGTVTEQKKILKNEMTKAVLAKIKNLLDSNVKPKDIVVLIQKRKFANLLIEANDDENIIFNLDKKGLLNNQFHILIIIEFIKLCKLHAQKISQNTAQKNAQENETNQNETNQNVSKFINLQNNIHQKRLNKLLSKNLDDNEIIDSQYIQIFQSQSLKTQIKDAIEKYQLFSEDSIKFLQYAIDNHHISNIDDLLEITKDIQSSSFKDNAVNIMTIHASKGLEFDHVIYMDIIGPNNTDEILYNYDCMTLENILFFNKYLKDVEIYKQIIEKKEKNDNKENLNKIYVALTRAIKGLYIFAESKSYITKQLQLSDYEMQAIQSNDTNDIVAMNDSQNLQDYNTAVEQDLKEYNNRPTNKKNIISNIQKSNEVQDDFISKQKDDENIFLPSLNTFEKQIIGRALHLMIELRFGYSAMNALDIVRSKYGYYNVHLDKISQGMKNFNLSLKNLMQNKTIKSEVSYLGDDNTFKIIDMILMDNKNLVILEFKSTEKIDPFLIKKHTKQLSNYLNMVKKYINNYASAYLIYLEENCEKMEVEV